MHIEHVILCEFMNNKNVTVTRKFAVFIYNVLELTDTSETGVQRFILAIIFLRDEPRL